MVISRLYRGFKTQIRDDREFSVFLLVGLLLGLAGGIFNSIFPNYLNDFYRISEQQRGILEIPRECAGLVVMLVVGALSALGDVRLSRVSLILNVAGAFGIALLAPRYSVMIVWLFVFSLGQHVFMPLTPKIGMSLSRRENFGARLARYSAFGLVAGIAGNGIVWVGMRLLHMGYRPLFISAGVFYLGAAAAIFFMRADKPDRARPRFVLRKKYALYYALCLTNGARKQIFLTFAPWVLITVFGVGAPTFAVLGVIISLVSVGTRTAVGRAIDRLGERAVLTAEAALLVLICLGYALSGRFFSAAAAVVIIAVCYIIDSSMSVVEMARSTYVRKIASDESDVTPTLAAGTSIDHIASMSVPALGGMLWAATGDYRPVFFVAAGIAVVNIVLTSRIKIGRGGQGEGAEEPSPMSAG
ncbi:MAG: MFS transporter [Firmicutes bacterium]|nr:MFS transporter [Bacillota bacterium]